MAGPPERDYDPREPHIELWKRLLKHYPGKGNGRKKTDREKREIALRVQNYYLVREHPRKGRDFKNPE